MSRRRRAALLAGLSLLLAGLAASDVASREAALDRRVGAPVSVVVARAAVGAGSPFRAGALAVKKVPARFAPRGAIGDPAALRGMRAAVDVPAGSEVLVAMVRGEDAGPSVAGAPVRRGERVAEVLASGAAEAIEPGGRVDVLVTGDDAPGRPGRTVLALEDVEVLAAAPGPEAPDGGGARVAVSLRVTLRQAVYLAAAQAYARELRLLPRALGDRGHLRGGAAVGAHEVAAG